MKKKFIFAMLDFLICFSNLKAPTVLNEMIQIVTIEHYKSAFANIVTRILNFYFKSRHSTIFSITPLNKKIQRMITVEQNNFFIILVTMSCVYCQSEKVNVLRNFMKTVEGERKRTEKKKFDFHKENREWGKRS